jgi:hypothetical protein
VTPADLALELAARTLTLANRSLRRDRDELEEITACLITVANEVR